MAVSRAVKESPLRQGEDEQIVYLLTTTPWGGSPSSVSVKLYDVTDGARADVSATRLSGAASVAGDVIASPAVTSLVAGRVYRLEFKFTSGGNVLEAYLIINAEY